MPVFKQRSNLFCLMTNDYEVIVECRWGSGGVVSSVVVSWRSLGGSSGCKNPEIFWSFYIWRANKYLKIEESQQANLF